MNYPWSNPSIWHGINVHLPIVLAAAGLPLVCWLVMSRGRSRALRRGAVAAYLLLAVAGVHGMQTGGRGMRELRNALPPAAWERMNFHQWMAEKVWLLAGVTGLLLLLANIPRRWARHGFLTLALVASVVTAAWVALTGHSGGVAVYEFGMG